MQVALNSLVTFNPWSISPEMSLRDFAASLPSAEFHHWPVVDDEQMLLGIVSDADLIRTIHERVVAASHAGASQWAAVRRLRMGELISRPTETVGLDEHPWRVLRRLLDLGIQSLPVVDRGRLEGLVTTTDFLRDFSFGEWPISRRMVNEQLEPVTEPLESDVDLDGAAAAMHLAQATALAVVRGALPLGVVSRRDLRMAKLRQVLGELFEAELSLPGARTIAELAASGPTVRPGERLSNAAAQMLEQRRQAAAVVNQAGRLLGVVTEDLLLRAMLESLR